MSPEVLFAVEAIGTVAGMLGASLVSSNKKANRRAGFAVWVVGNVFFIAASIERLSYPMMGLWMYYTITSMKGYLANQGRE